MHDGVFVAHFVGSLCRPSRSNAALFDKVFDEVSDKVFPEHPPGTGSKQGLSQKLLSKTLVDWGLASPNFDKSFRPKFPTRDCGARPGTGSNSEHF